MGFHHHYYAHDAEREDDRFHILPVMDARDTVMKMAVMMMDETSCSRHSSQTKHTTLILSSIFVHIESNKAKAKYKKATRKRPYT